MFFGSVELNVQFFTLAIAFMAVILPLLFNLLARKDKQIELKQRSIELLISVEDKLNGNKQDDVFGYTYAKNDCLRTMTNYVAGESFFYELNKFKDPIKALEIYRRFHLRIDCFPEKPILKNRLIPFITFMVFSAISLVMLPIMSQITYNTYSELDKKFDDRSTNPVASELSENITIKSNSEWVIDSEKRTITIDGSPKLALVHDAVKKAPINTQNCNAQENEENNHNSDSEKPNNASDCGDGESQGIFAQGMGFVTTSVLLLSVIMSFVAQIFLFALFFGSLIKGFDYLTEPKANLKTAIELKDKYSIGPQPQRTKAPGVISLNWRKFINGCYQFSLYIYFSATSAIGAYLRKS